MNLSEARAEPRPVIVASDLLGTLHVSWDELLDFPTGLFGFPDQHSYVLANSDRKGLYWLQSVDQPNLTFLLADPFVHFEGYTVDLGPGELHDLRVAHSAEVAVFAIVTLPRRPGERPTANLQGPVALNLRAQMGKQLALQDSGYGVRTAFSFAAVP